MAPGFSLTAPSPIWLWSVVWPISASSRVLPDGCTILVSNLSNWL